MPTWRRWMSDAVSRLTALQIPESPALVEFAVADTLRISRMDVRMRAADEARAEDAAKCEEHIRRLCAGEPLAYVLGHAPFLGRSFLCDRRALIPRPETEELVERVLDDRELWGRGGPVFAADIGTGTGCIAITLALERPVAHVIGVDISPDALALARENAGRLGAGVEWRLGDALAVIADHSLDLVVSNPPYISTAECSTLEKHVREYEPHLALDGGEDGLSIIRRLVKGAVRALKPQGRLYMEISGTQGESVRECLAAAGFDSVGIHRDLFGLTRFATGIKNGSAGCVPVRPPSCRRASAG